LNEAAALLWRDVDLIKGTLTITGGSNRTKNDETRTIPLTKVLRELLQRMHSEQQPSHLDSVRQEHSLAAIQRVNF
jgi:integrase